MKIIWSSPYRNFFIAGLLCTIVASWFSLGYHQIDEHFMILEFANYKFGTVPKEVIPWEFTNQMRPTLQPSIAYAAFALLHRMGLANPFVQVFMLRLLAGLLAWFVACRMALHAAPELHDEQPKRWWIISVACLWFMPYLQVRFSSENFAGFTFLAALLLLPNVFRRGIIQANYLQWLGAGMLLAASFYFRFQMAFAIGGLLFWLMLYARPLWKPYLFLLLGAVLGIGLNLLTDYWFYGEWVLSPYNYYVANITKDAASTYGTSPWYDYFILFATQGIPPISWVLLLLFFIGLWKRPMQLMVFIFVPFLIGHCVVSHKEFRFLYPMVIPFLFICFTGLQSIWASIKNKKWTMPVFKFLVVVNILLMGYRCVWPAKPNHFYYKFLNKYAQGKPIHLITLGRGIFSEGHNQIYLYRPTGFTEDTMSDGGFKKFVQLQNADSLLVMSYQPNLPFSDSRYTQVRLYVYLPGWIMNIKLNDWQSRSDIWSVWLLRKKK